MGATVCCILNFFQNTTAGNHYVKYNKACEINYVNEIYFNYFSGICSGTTCYHVFPSGCCFTIQYALLLNVLHMEA